MRILLAEDDEQLGQGTSEGLTQLGFSVDWVKDGIAAELAAKDNDQFDVLVLDLGLPRQDGLSVMQHLRVTKNDIPILILTARDAVEQRIEGLNGGADDYMIKPFDLHELAARIRAVARRRTGRATLLIEHGDIALDPAAKTVTFQGQEVLLSSYEFTTLELLLNNKGRVLTRQQIETNLYGWQDGVESNAIEVYIHHLRKKLGKKLIRTVRGMGYSIA